jgi:2-hydroxychromene-2-carboxylate isomerase
VAAALAAAGLDGEALVARAGDPENKQRLREATDEAIARGVFGVPTLFVDGELFWGTDALADVERFARGEDPVSPALAEAWDRTPAAAVRPAARVRDA